MLFSRGPRRRDGAEREGDFSGEKYSPYSRKQYLPASEMKWNQSTNYTRLNLD